MIKIKRKLLMDFTIYIVTPIILCIFTGIDKFNYYIFYLILTGICYTSYTKYKQNRVNISGISIMLLLTLYMYFSKNQNKGLDIYTYTTYVIGLSTGIILLLNLFNKNIINQIYTDILNTKFSNSFPINTIIRRQKLRNDFNYLTLVIILELLVSIFIRLYSIINYGELAYQIAYGLELVNLIIFTLIELYKICNIIVKTIEDKLFLNKDNIKNSNTEVRVINLSKYRKINK